MRFDDDELRCRFTAWMKIVVIRKKLEYIRKFKRHKSEVPFEDGKLHNAMISELFDIAETNLQELIFVMKVWLQLIKLCRQDIDKFSG